ncbi:MAG: ABC transporter permease [Solirubrobacteraceae bacterium]
MRPYALLYFYRRRLRIHGTQELFAVLGVAVSVALVFAVTLANGSIAGSAERVARAVVGPATLQLRGRAGEGFSESLLGRAEALPGVKQAAPLLEQTTTITTAGGHTAAVDLAGTDLSLATLNGLGRTLPLSALSPGGIGLSRATAAALDLRGVGARVSLRMRGLSAHAHVSAVLGPETFGALSGAQVAVMPLARLQALARVPHQISRVLVQVKPGHERQVRAELQTLAGNRLSVVPATQDVALLRGALGPSNQASALFAAISVLIGFLFVFNAALLTAPERRQTIADLRVSGTRRPAIVQMVLFQALCLGLAASAIGLLAGYALALGVLRSSPSYLSRAFALSTSTVVGWLPLLVAVLGGLLVTCLAAAVPLLDLRGGRPVDAIYQERGAPGNALAPGTRPRLFALALLLIAVASVLFALVPSAALLACLLLALATVLAVPLALAGVLALAGLLARRLDTLTALPLALGSLRSTATIFTLVARDETICVSSRGLPG